MDDALQVARKNAQQNSLTNVEFRANLSVKLVEWASLDYQFKTLREPQLIDEFQIQNNLLFTFGLATGSASPEEAAE